MPCHHASKGITHKVYILSLVFGGRHHSGFTAVAPQCTFSEPLAPPSFRTPHSANVISEITSAPPESVVARRVLAPALCSPLA